jgi:hypothetical protein
MQLNDLLIQISTEAGLGENPEPHKSMLLRNLKVVLEEMDGLVTWRCAVIDFSKTVPANANKVLVSNVNLFKPIICRWVDSDSVEHPLTYRELTNYWIEDADYGTDTNDSPTLYTIAGGYIYVGPGVMDAATTITGQARRRLSTNDVDELPAPMLVDGTVKRVAKKGSPESIAAWNGWNLSKSSILTAAARHTGEERDVQPLDPVIARNISYLQSL